jgi:hypothetical protein
MEPAHNFFAVLTMIAAPAVLTNASSLLALNTANRFGRVVDRARQLTVELQSLATDGELYATRRRQLFRLRVRAHHLMRAQSFIYFALGLFVAAALTAVIGSVLSSYTDFAYRAVALLGLVVGVGATSSLLYGCLLIVRETRLALASLREDIEMFDLPK